MSPAAAQELQLCYSASLVEGTFATAGDRLINAEALQRALWRHRAEIHQLIVEREAADIFADQLMKALRPFAKAASILAPGQNPVLISLPSATPAGRTFVQLRPADFRMAADVLGMEL
ncbi:hypothetical protein [Brevundimonas sp. UBA7664]|uniref:hypothetical protein n=1 Tax=Brevundimonas sp. UBA7664 TaxID=1946141 RepID=UPI0025C01262|nr:hypothetical protein [Brevundimonas sp. UBA7664]